MPRLFVAIRPPPVVIDALIDTMEGLETARWQDEEQLHLTLAFAGEVEWHRAQDLCAALSSISFEPLDLIIEGVGHFEHKGRVTAIWARVSKSAPLLALHQRVTRACESAGIALEHRRFTPHITLARLSDGAPGLGDWLAYHQGLTAPPFIASHFSLFSSKLSPAGSIYDELARFPD